MKIPESYFSITKLIDNYHAAKEQQSRPHLGASLLGHPCDRWLWLSFRWAVTEKFEGRILRLFRRGHNEEASIINDLRSVGVEIFNSQTRVDFGAHVSGSLDGIIESGVPEAPTTRHVAEFKTHSKKSFDDLVKNGVEKSKPLHFVQMQVYMLGTHIDRALYVAVCKDDDRLYSERIKLDKSYAQAYVERGKRIALSERMPEPMSADPSWYQCKFCPAHEFCHSSHVTKNVNCRTCAHSTAKEDSTWRCERHRADNIPVDFQQSGCDLHVLHPDLVPWKLDTDASSEVEAVWIIDGTPVRNGEPDAHVYSSKELLANPSACKDELVNHYRSQFPDARVVG